MRNGLIISTTDRIEGYEIEKYLGIISERIVVGAGIFSEFTASFRDLVGGRSGSFEKELDKLHNIAMDKVTNRANLVGANALIGIRMDIDEISGKGTQMFMINISGTAIICNSNNPVQINFRD